MKKMNLLKWKFAFLLSFCFVGASFAAPAYDIVESVQSFVGPEEAIEILNAEHVKIQAEMAILIEADKKQEAYTLRLKSKVFSDLAISIDNTKDVQSSFDMYFAGNSFSGKSALTKMTPVQINTVRAEVNALLQD